MRGMMMDRPLLVSSLLRHAALGHGEAEIVSRTVEGQLVRYTYRDAERRAKQLANALRHQLGIQMGDRVATLAWNTHRHFELYFGIAGLGAVCHTINPRLFREQIRYIVNHAQDRVIFLDTTFVPLVENLAADFRPVRHYVIMTDRQHMPETTLPGALCYEDLLAAETPDLEWPEFDENTASSLCYTSGTTGNPKGVLYSHRSTVLHTFGFCLPDNAGISMSDVVCPISSMFHANAWGSPYAAALAGAKLVLPGPQVDGATLYRLFEEEGVTISLGVPTIWFGLLSHLEQTGQRLSTLERVLIGGSAAPLSMIKAFDRYGARVIHAWGMTETSPLATTGTLKPHIAARSETEQDGYKTSQGRRIYGVELKLVDVDGREQPWDGEARGEVLIRGPWVACGYFEDEAATRAAMTEDGWLRTGDIATSDPDGYLRLVDRSKDVIKSGGEWISSIDLENTAMGHPMVAEAAAIGVPHEKWAERPLLVIVPKEGCRPTREEILAFFSGKVAKWQIPDDVVFVAEIPHTATGKILKSKLRETYQGHLLLCQTPPIETHAPSP